LKYRIHYAPRTLRLLSIEPQVAPQKEVSYNMAEDYSPFDLRGM
jgi:hypothetical protein